jgi:hypothetical protein
MRTRIYQIAALWVAAAGASWGGQRPLAIALYNYADLPPDVLESAMKMVVATLGDSGIQPAWSLCLIARDRWVDGCTQRLPSDGRYVTVNLMLRQNAPQLGPGLGYEVAGFAIQDSARIHGARAFAFYDSVKAIAEKSHRRAAVVLACVLVHEIAHTLGLRHQEQGVMRPVLDPRGMDDAVRGLAFDELQGRLLREAVAGLNQPAAE